MQELQKKIDELSHQVSSAIDKLKVAESEKKLSELKKKAEAPDFWSDNQTAQDNLKIQAKLESKIKPWRTMQSEINDCIELIMSGDKSLAAELEKQTVEITQKFDSLKAQLKFNGPFDDHDAIISIYAGAGGTDAQDWAQMLERMYLRWAESNGIQSKVLDESVGEEAGIKSVTIELTGDFIFAKLKGEHGVHRLVRLSPFNADHLRQTSFAKVEVMPKIERPDEIELDEKDLKIDVYRSGGHGGQSVNTTDSAVRVTHIPTGVTAAIQNERSQLQNKETALNLIRSKLAQLQLEQHKEHLSEIKGPNQSAEWGNQIRNYVLHPYKQVKDLRTGFETSEPDKILDGNLNLLIDAYLEYNLAS